MKYSGKNIFLSVTLSMTVCPTCLAQNTSANFIETVIKSSQTDSVVQIDYHDGLGRLQETVMKGYTPHKNDLITLQEYDSKGRPSNLWKPVYKSATGNNEDAGSIKQMANGQWGTAYPYNKNVYENSPLDRILQVFGPGTEWHQSGKAVITAYSSNNNTECARYSFTASGQLLKQGCLPANSLEKLLTTDEDGVKTAVFKDVYGNTILERVLDGSICYDTYYVYDQYGNLRMVIPPAASDLLTTDNTYWNKSNSIVRQYCYYYEYDGSGLCTLKQLPGCDPVKFKYDKAGRMIFSQDGNQRTSNQWTFFLYDKFGRMAVQGTCNSAIPDISTLTVVATPSSSGSYAGYSTNISLSNTQLLVVNYYDNYSFIDYATSTEKNILNFVSYNGYPSKYDNVMGLQTGSRCYQLGSPSKYTIKAFYYDEKSRVICTRSTNHLGGKEIFHTHFSLSDKPLKTIHEHTGMSEVTEEYTFTYDHSDRLKTKMYKINNAQRLLASYNYDEYGRLDSKNVGGMENISYTYNVRDWLTRIGSNKFEENLLYQKSDFGVSPSKLCYNGNISAMTWKTGNDNKVRGYKFSYDHLNRLTASAYGEGSGLSSNVNRYGETFQYDKMGNIEAITRYGLQDNNVYGKVDDLTFIYNGNQVVKVDDTVSGPFYSGAFHFVDGSNATTEYTYDKNGNMTKDLNKRISSIEYNLLNLPSRIKRGNGFMAYAYNAIGEKMHYSREVDYGGNSSCTPSDGGGDCRYLSITEYTDYCGNVIYEGDDFSEFNTTKVMTDEGYITFNGSTPQYHFYLKDHLGNNRVVLNAGGGIEQVNHYYSFGGLMGESTNGDVQAYKYNGKELDRMNGLDWYDYGARHMDGIRFTTIDPMAEKYYGVSPYAYCKDNPIKYIDIKGEKPGDFFISKDEAAKDFGIYYNDNSIRTNREFASYIFEVRDCDGIKGYSYSIATVGDRNGVKPQSEIGANNIATIHTHAAYDSELGQGNELFSGSFKPDTGEYFSSEEKRKSNLPNDIGNSNKRGTDSYLVTPNGSLQKYNPLTGKITVISNDMPSDANDPYRLNYIDIKENNPTTIWEIMQMQENINKGILYNQ